MNGRREFSLFRGICQREGEGSFSDGEKGDEPSEAVIFINRFAAIFIFVLRFDTALQFFPKNKSNSYNFHFCITF